MSFDNKFQKLPLDIGIQIAGYLTAQELVNASASCKFFYTYFANQAVWESAYRELLKGYPADRFVITDVVKRVKRPNYVTFHSTQKPQVVWLKDWRTSWKQRTVFVLHVLNVQRQLVAIAQQQTRVFKPALTAPLYDSNFILQMEEHVGAIFPIDFVLFLQNFAHYLMIDFDPEFPKAALASGSMFENEQSWKQAIQRSHFRVFNTGDTEQQQPERTQHLSDAAVEYLNGLKSVCFSMLRTTNDFSEGEDYLSLVLDIDSNLQDQVPPIAAHDFILVDFASIENGIGKVAYSQLLEGQGCRFSCIAESFTDYLIQYDAVIMKLGILPDVRDDGYSDLVSPLPRFPGLPKSILLPQHEGWNVANYSPLFFTKDRDRIFRTTGSTLLSMIYESSRFQWDLNLPDPPYNMINGFSQAWWEPYSVPEAQRNGKIPTSFKELKDKEIPKPETRQMTVDIYHIEQQMIDDWLEKATTATGYATEARDAEAVEQVRQRTSQIMSLFEIFKARLPAMLYYSPIISCHKFLFFYKNFIDHLRALDHNEYKYSVEELQIVEEQLRNHLNFVHPYALKTTRGRFGYGIELDGISELAIDWSRV
ncbi:hypothetical protein VKS41_007754 [Umbelopsis sp. WA50703]